MARRKRRRAKQAEVPKRLPQAETPKQRLAIRDGFWKIVTKAKGRVSRRKVDEVFGIFISDSNRASLKFQPVVGQEGFWKIKVTKSVHVLLKKCEDGKGTFFLAVDLQDHDDY